MTATIESLTPAQLAAVYNHHTDTPVKKFENRQKGARRLLALLAKIEVAPADAIAAVIPTAAAQVDMTRDDAPPMTTYPEAMPVAAAIMADVHAKFAPNADASLPDDPDWTPADVGYGDKIEDDERLAAEAASAAKPTRAELNARLFSAKAAPTREAEAEADRENDETFRQVAEAAAPKAAAAVERRPAELTAKQAAKAAKLKQLDTTPKAHVEPASAPAPAVTGKARTLIAAAASRPEGASSTELYAITGWKFASWSHQMKLITKEAGIPHEMRKVDGTTRYFLRTESAK